MLPLPFFLGEGFGDGLFIGVRDVSVLSVQLASVPTVASLSACSFPWIPQCAGTHCRVWFVWAARSAKAASTSLRFFWWGVWSLLKSERASVMITTLGLVRGKLSLISVAAFLRASALKCGHGDVCHSIIVPNVHPTSQISGGFCCRTICVGVGPLVFWVLGVDILQSQ